MRERSESDQGELAELRSLVVELRARQAELEQRNAALLTELESRREAGQPPIEFLESRAGFRRIFRESPLGAALLDSDFRFVEINPRFEQMLGYGQAEASQNNLCSLILSERDPLTLSQAARLKAGEIPVYAAEKPCQTKAGALIWGLITLSVIRGPQGDFVCFLATINDITARKQAEAELSESEERYRNLFEAESDAIFLIDNETGRILEANSAAEALYGFSRVELLEKCNFELSAEPEETQQVTHGTPVIADNIVTIPLRYHRKADGTVFPIEITGRFFVRHGKPVHLAAIRDISARKQAEQEHAQIQDQLRQAQKMESIGRLAGGVAHDLNNMLTPILGYASMLLDDLAPGDTRRHSVENIAHAGSRARDLVHQLLAFSRKQVLEFRSIDLNSELKVVNTLLRRAVREDIVLKFKPTDGGLFIRGDLGQLEQMLMNLAVNAQDAMPEGGTLTIATGLAEFDAVNCPTELNPGRYALLSITDSGHGMDLETQRQIFEPFFTTKAVGKGTGLGLSMVYGTVKQHGGGVMVESRPGQGATFRIYLPLCLPPDEPCAKTSPTCEIALGAETILLVEDNDLALELTESILKRQGYTVLSAASGPAALEIAKAASQPIDLLLTDVIMPEMNGRQLYNELAGTHPELKVLFMSGHPESVITTRGVLADSLNFIAKPFMVNALVAKVREVLSAE